MKNSTSIQSVWNMIRAHFGFQITGAHFLNFANLHLEADERPENLFQRLMAFVEDTLLRANSLSHHGEDKCGNRFFAWESTFVKIWGNSLAAGISTGSVTGNYLQRRQQHSELSNICTVCHGHARL